MNETAYLLTNIFPWNKIIPVKVGPLVLLAFNMTVIKSDDEEDRVTRGFVM